MRYNSKSEALERSLIELMDNDINILCMIVEDTILPSVHLANISVSLMMILNEVKQFEVKSGKTEKSKERVDKLLSMLKSCDYLSKLANQNNIFQLAMKHQDMKIKKLIEENKELKKELEAIKKAFAESE